MSVNVQAITNQVKQRAAQYGKQNHSSLSQLIKVTVDYEVIKAQALNGRKTPELAAKADALLEQKQQLEEQIFFG